MESKICRVCLDRTATISLFDKLDNIQYREKIMKCVTVIIEEGDGLPDAICDNCAAELSISYEFAQKCEASDRALRCLGLLAPDLKEEQLKTEVKLEPISKEIISEYADEALDYDDYVDHLPDLKYDLEISSTIKTENKNKKIKLQEKYMKPLPNHLRKNKHRVYSGPIQCMMCGRILKCQSAYEQHLRTHTKEKPFGCDLCKKSFRTKSSMKLHIYRHYGIQELDQRKLRPLPDWDGRKKGNKSKSSPILCIICGLKVNCRSALETHMRKHTGDKPFTCPECTKSYTLKGSLMRHIEVNHTKQALRAHIDRHNNPGKYICNFCGTAFTVKGNLNLHVIRIHSEKSGTCTVCHKTFPNLQVHMRVHNGEKPYICKLCNQGFMTQRSLSHHTGFKHRDAAKFKCTTGQCDKAFPTISMLEFHVLKAHLDNTPYICQHCARGFLRPCDLSRHLKMNHMDHTRVKSQFIKTVHISDP
ncbi:Uncharacterized protein OBRU01_06758 [Operophtera brumata]|uniref:Uncharacterized protein n=1 Tax=Operophtera brumata TaxID=104452 RepID=A0A0L7LK64_OPEBR|nr:Uncharacterized protein OBRU01_06758 [Operophtera brumata]